jgi:3-(3-hydroxy-phenyl)propionate hydroxylase
VTDASYDCDVLIVGAGPTGSSLALHLAQAGLTVIVAEKEADIYPLPRAAHIDHEAMRIFQSLGLAEAIFASCRSAARYDFVTKDRQVLLRFDGSDAIGPGGWPIANMIHQPSIERALRDKTLATDGIDLRTQWSFTGFAQEEEKISAEFATTDGCARVAARYLVGADGARSPVRTMAGIEFDDLEFEEPWLVIDAIVHDPSRLPDINLQICDPERPTSCVVMGAGRHRWEFMMKPGETPEHMLDDAFIAELLEPWDVEGAVSLERKAVYTFKARIATKWRSGRVFLVGDAAHQMPPFAGQGLCSGLRDAANLGWKLAAVLKCGAPDALLDQYQPEREPNVRSIINMAMMMGRTVCLLDPEAAAARDANMLAAREAGLSQNRGAGFPPVLSGCILADTPGAGSYFPQVDAQGEARRFDDILGPGAWLICKEEASKPAGIDGIVRTVSLEDPDISAFAPAIGRWLDERGSSAVLARPDRYVFGSGEPAALIGGYLAWVSGRPHVSSFRSS